MIFRYAEVKHKREAIAVLATGTQEATQEIHPSYTQSMKMFDACTRQYPFVLDMLPTHMQRAQTGKPKMFSKQLDGMERPSHRSGPKFPQTVL